MYSNAPVDTGVVERGVVVEPTGIDVGAGSEQKIDNFGIAVIARLVQRRPAGIVHGVNVGPLGNTAQKRFQRAPSNASTLGGGCHAHAG